MRSWGRRVDEETGALHAAVAQEHDYTLEQALYVFPVGNGLITCSLRRADGGPARRLVQLRAEYTDAGVAVCHVVQCDSEADEVRQLMKLERVMRDAERRPTAA